MKASNILVKTTPRLRNIYGYEKSVGEKVDSKSETVPDMAMTIPEIMRRFSSGRGVPNNGLEYSEDMPDLRNVDIEQKRLMHVEISKRAKKLRDEDETKRKERAEALQRREKKLQELLDAEELDNITGNPNVNEPKNKRSGKKGEEIKD